MTDKGNTSMELWWNDIEGENCINVKESCSSVSVPGLNPGPPW